MILDKVNFDDMPNFVGDIEIIIKNASGGNEYPNEEDLEEVAKNFDSIGDFLNNLENIYMEMLFEKFKEILQSKLGDDIKIKYHTNARDTYLNLITPSNETFEFYDISSYDNFIQTILQEKLFKATIDGNLREVKKYIENGVNVDVKNYYNTTALIKSLENKHYDIAKYLIEQGANVNTQDDDGITPLTAALNNKENLEIVKFLIEHGADVNAKDEDGETALLFAVFDNYYDIAKYFIEHGADVNAKNKDGETALIGATKYEYFEIVELLVKNGIDMNAKDNDGNSALMHASFEGYCDIAKLLIENGADVNITNNNDNTALDFAYRQFDKEISDLLIANGAKTNEELKHQITHKRR